LSPGRG